MSQTAYSQDVTIGFAGMRADDRPATFVSLLNEESSANLPFGVMLKQGTTDRTCKLPSTSSDIIVGFSAASGDVDSASLSSNGAIAPKCAANVAKKGAFYALPEQNVTKGDPIYVRYTAGAGALTVGRLRKDPDGTAQITTYTPTAGTSATYQVSINGRAFQYLGDGTDTAAEVVTAMIALVNADTDLPVTATGTSTLILTADVAGVPFLTSATANMSAAATQANVAKASLLANCKWDSTALADAPAVVALNLV